MDFDFESEMENPIDNPIQKNDSKCAQKNWGINQSRFPACVQMRDPIEKNIFEGEGHRGMLVAIEEKWSIKTGIGDIGC
jgi:hypothetical protein